MSLDGTGNPFIKVPREESENQTKVNMWVQDKIHLRGWTYIKTQLLCTLQVLRFLEWYFKWQQQRAK